MRIAVITLLIASIYLVSTGYFDFLQKGTVSIDSSKKSTIDADEKPRELGSNKEPDPREIYALAIILKDIKQNELQALSNKRSEYVALVKGRGKVIDGEVDYDELYLEENGVEVHLRMYLLIGQGNTRESAIEIAAFTLPFARTVWFDKNYSRIYMENYVKRLMHEDDVDKFYIADIRETLPNSFSQFQPLQ